MKLLLQSTSAEFINSVSGHGVLYNSMLIYRTPRVAVYEPW